jgi:DNA-directed RNA polymerase specialized sigma24 family protein
MCGVSDEDERIADVNQLADQAINNLKFLNLGFTLGYLMTDLERTVYFHHQIRKCNFKEISKLLNKSEPTLRMAWKRCKLRGDRALEDSIL